ncbi:MAG TPA: aminotransferase class I/II-fold pyridoxal phosphate-dependent enzyme [Chthoniobacterales bacterium]|nr:aminotransferase class I/II-fold pyridoxal phosphate-dependent enzyme [Chthoniobacterales bacterium]
MNPQTKLIHSARDRNATHAITSPIWQSTSFEADSIADFAEISQTIQPREYYTRYGNPGHEQVETVLAEMESGEAAMVTASGMGAIFTAVMSLLRQGDHVVAQKNIYASAATLFQEVLRRWGIECTHVEQTGNFADALRPNTKLIYTETPANPLMGLTDLRALAEIAKPRGIITMVDNTFATPINQRPIELGIDVVVHSATKYLSGHHDVMSGAIVASKEFIERAWRLHIVVGAVLSPFDSWLLLRGVRTLELRVERHNRNALAVAKFLEAHPAVARVNYPFLESHPQSGLARAQMSGGTGMLSVEFRAGYAAAEKFIRAVKLGRYAASLGGFTTLLVHPAAMWAESLSSEQRAAMGVDDSLVRISIGLEDERDLIADFAQALDLIP